MYKLTNGKCPENYSMFSRHTMRETMPPIPKHICQINWPKALACKQMQLAHFQDAVEVSVSQRSPTLQRT